MLPIFFSSTDAGAPSLNNTAGSLLEVLRACLITGYNARSVSSIVVASAVATATIATHGYTGVAGKRILISGAPEAGLNGSVQPLSVTTNTVVYSAPGVADGTYTGTISAVRTPMGWTEEFTGTNKAMFARSSVEALGQMLRVDDSGVSSIARLVGVVSATDIDTYTGEFPSAEQLSGGAYWQKGPNSGTAKAWFLLGDDLGFYFGSQLASASEFAVYWFGDPIPYYAGDSGFTVLTGQTNSSYHAGSAYGLLTGQVSVVNTPASVAAMYAPNGILPAQSTPQFQATLHLGGGYVSGSSLYPDANVYPNIPIHPLIHVTSTDKSLRGRMPGMGHILAANPFANFDILSVDGGPWLVVGVRPSSNSGQVALNLADWRV